MCAYQCVCVCVCVCLSMCVCVCVCVCVLINVCVCVWCVCGVCVVLSTLSDVSFDPPIMSVYIMTALKFTGLIICHNR